MPELDIQQKNIIKQLKQTYPEFKNYPDEKILSLYNQELNNIQLTKSEQISIINGKNNIADTEMGLKLEFSQTSVSKKQEKQLKTTLITRLNAVNKNIEMAENSNGFLGSIWSGFKNLTGIGDSSNKVKKQQNADLKALQGSNIAEAFKQITGIDYTKENVTKFLNNEIQTKSEVALNGYTEGQDMASDVIADMVSGITAVGIYTAAVAAAPFTGGASIAVGVAATGVCAAAIKTGIKYADAKSGGRGYTTDNLKKDLATGAFSGVLAPITGGMGGAIGKTVATKVGIQAVKQVGKEVAEEAVEQTAKGFVKTMLTNPTGYEYVGGSFVKRGLAFAAETATDGAVGGAVDNAFRTAYDGGSLEDVGDATIQGFVGGAIMSPLIGGGMKAIGKSAQKIFGKNDVSIDAEGNEILLEKLCINKKLYDYFLNKNTITCDDIELLFPAKDFNKENYFMQEILKTISKINPKKHVIDFNKPFDITDYEIIAELFNIHNGKYKKMWLTKSKTDEISNIEKLAIFARIIRNLKKVNMYLNFDEKIWNIIAKGIIEKPQKLIRPLITYKINSNEINGALTKNVKMTPEIKEMIEEISKYIANSPINDNINVYRGETSYWIFGNKEISNGVLLREEIIKYETCNKEAREAFITDVLMDIDFEYPRFLSTAFDINDAEVRAEKILWHLDVPQNTKGTMIESYNIERESESEFLIQRNSELSILDVIFNEEKKRWEIFARVLQRVPLTPLE